MLRKFFMDEEGMGTVEMVLIIAALVSVAIIFRTKIIEFVSSALDSIFSKTN